MKKYNHLEIEKKWQDCWDKNGFYLAEDFSKKPKKYILIEFPYPSGEGLHVGHARSYSALDAVARKKRMEGYNVLFPIGWDAFGLPAENYAIKTGTHPEVATQKNINNYKRQLRSLGLSFDWKREVNTTESGYYKWTQWIFLKLFEKGLAYQAEIPINFCPSCKIGLANEEVISGNCERCGTKVLKKILKQWMLKITAYADRLINDLKDVDYPEKVKVQQINWIGRSEGVQIEFKVYNSESKISVFTTRADTIFGVTAIVLAPENSLVESLVTAENKDKVQKYTEEAKKKSDFEREQLEKEKTGVFTGSYCLNPMNNEKVPIWVGDYVVATYGGGAVMVVPAHDYRDYDFAKKYNLLIRPVVARVVTREGDIDAWRIDEKENKRLAAVCIVKHWSENKYLFLQKNVVDKAVVAVSGGVDEGEDLVAAGIREIREESGYKSAKFVRFLGAPVFYRYYSVTAKQNRISELTPLYYELSNGDRDKVSTEEKKQHDVIWVNENEIEKYINGGRGFNLIFWNRFKNAKELFMDDGMLINSGEFDYIETGVAKKKITEWLEKKEAGVKKINYKLRDWVFSRQHYWGEPIPIIHCKKCGTVPVAENDLPVKLPYVEKYQPTGTGESPLSAVSEWVNVKCPKCHGLAKRETDTMPNWAGSNWYYMRYCDPNNDESLADKKKLKYWLPVDWYNGGFEHTTLHLLYSRFIYKFLYDIGTAPTLEPYSKRTSHGIVLAEDSRKMSKSFGNTINPDDVIKEFGADTLRIYEMFMGPFDQAIAWSTQGVRGVYRFLEKTWKLQDKIDHNLKKQDRELERLLHNAIKKISEDLESCKFNTAVSTLMTLVNGLTGHKEKITKDSFETLLKLLAPFAPHITEEIWQQIKNKGSIHDLSWPKYDEKMAKKDKITLIVQINGKVRDRIEIETGTSEQEAKKLTLNKEKVKNWIRGKKVKKVIFVPDKLINIVI